MSARRSQQFRQCRWTMAILLAASAGISSGAGLAAQVNPVIDPCSRALAALESPVATGSPNPSSIRLAVAQTVMDFASCFNLRDWAGVLAIAAPSFLESMYGVSDPELLRVQLDLLETRGLLPDLKIESIEENGTTGNQLATLVVTWHGWKDVHRELWRVQRENGFWRLTGRSIQDPHLVGRAVGIRFRIERSGLVAPLEQIASPGIVILSFENSTDQIATALVLLVESGKSAELVANACSASESQRFEPVGRVQAPAGETVTVPLQDLEPGRYAIIVDGEPCAGKSAVPVERIKLLDIAQAVET